MSVQGASAEEIPYALPTIPAASTDIGALVKRLPGANVNSNGVVTNIAQYRGLFGRRVNVVLDGFSQHEAGPNSMDSPLSYLPASRADQVSVYRGIAPVRTGIETIGGTISADSTKVGFGQTDEAEIGGKASAAYASNGNTRQLNLTTAITNRNHRLQLSGSSDRGDNQKFDGGVIRSSEHDRDTIGLHYGYQDSGKAFGLDVEHFDMGDTGTPALPMDILYFRGENIKASFTDYLTNGDSYTLKLHHQDVEHEMDNFSHRTNGALIGSRARQVFAEVRGEGLGLHYQHQNWLFGIDLDQAEHNATIYNPNVSAFFIENFKDAERDRYSIFTEWKGAIAQGSNIETGLRYSRVEMDSGNAGVFAGAPAGLIALNTAFNGEDLSQEEDLVDVFATFTHEISQQADIEIGFARKTRAPSYQERYLWAPLQSTGGLADGRQYVGDVDLDHEVAYQFELGLDWHTHQFAISPRIFYHHINDYIQGVAGNATAQQQMVANAIATMLGGTPSTLLKFSNVDAKLYGIDANWSAALSSDWQLAGTVSYVRGKRRDTSDDLYRIAPLNAITSLTYVQPNWQVSVEAETVSRQNKISSENNEQKTGGYALFNISGQYQVTPAVTLMGGVNNLFDRYYVNHLGGINRAGGNPDLAMGDKIPGLGRSAYVNVNVDFETLFIISYPLSIWKGGKPGKPSFPTPHPPLIQMTKLSHRCILSPPKI
jgi:iron complex outermembrane receptor protein